VTVALVACVGATSARAATDTQWLSYGGTPQQTGASAGSSLADRVADFRRLWRTQLDGRIIASPLAALVGGELEIFAATGAGSVYALDTAGHVVWRTQLGAVESGAGCGTYGVSSTGAIDLARGLLYVANADGYVHGLDLTTGAEAAGWPVQVTARPRTEYVWGGLTLLGDRLYVPLASYCDAPDEEGVPAEGGVLALDVSHPGAVAAQFDPVPGANNLGGVWGWGGVSVAPDRRTLYFGVGNAEPDVDNGNSDSMVQVTVGLDRLVGTSRPPGAIPDADIDLGSAPVLFQPKGCPALLAANDKDGTLLIWRQGDLGAGVYQRIALGDGAFPFVGAPSWSAETQMLYDGGAVQRTGGTPGVQALAVDARCMFVKRWFFATAAGTHPQPLVSGGLVFATGGMKGGFYALRASSGLQLWHAATTAATWAPVIEADGVIVGGDLEGNVYGFYPRALKRIR
jgi:outer membrane protein assembly factor BamB